MNKKLIINALWLFCWMATSIMAQERVENMLFDGLENTGNHTVLRDNDGNYYISGFFSDSILVGKQIIYSHGLMDIFIAKFSPEKKLQWFQHAGSTKLDLVRPIQTDQYNNIYLSGLFRGDLMLGDTSLLSGRDREHFTAKYGASGELIWIRKNIPEKEKLLDFRRN